MLGWTRHGFCPWRLFDIAGTNVADAREYERTLSASNRHPR